jgi:hypothetical protein
VYCRYLSATGFRKFGSRYPNPLLFVAGLPKSGTTWVERMLTGLPGFHSILPPAVSWYEMKHGESHLYDLPDGFFRPYRNLLAVMKLHMHGSARNAEELRGAGLPYVVIVRDLRDVVVSYYFYCLNTPWHMDHRILRGMDREAGLRNVLIRRGPEFIHWVESWARYRDPARSILVSYEELSATPVPTMRAILNTLDVHINEAELQDLVDTHSFEAVSGGRKPGEVNSHSFFRQGKPGGWRKHFTPELCGVFDSLLSSVSPAIHALCTGSSLPPPEPRP